VNYDDGQSFVFSVKQSIIFSPFVEDNRLKEIEKSEKPTLVLISCWPVGTNYKRIAVQAELQ
jgi:sortase (surface protein transpeptidase)